jgi:hypothetical protein
MRRDLAALALVLLLPAADVWQNLAHLNIGLVDFYGLSAFAAGYALHGAWPATPYFPAGYPLLLIPFGYFGSTLVGGYILSALGIALALYSAWLLARQLGAGRMVAAGAVVLCWLAPVCRVVAGSPSVDALYSGLGLWFIAGALTAWRVAAANATTGQGRFPVWAKLGLLLPALVLPMLRYHAVVLLVPVALCLLLWRRERGMAVVALALCALALAFNSASYSYCYHKALPTAAGLQIATGLELRYHKLYPGGVDGLWQDYPAFSQRARASAMFEGYSFQEIAASWLGSWAMFLRQPAVLLLGVLLVCAWLMHRPLPRGPALGLLWLVAYTLALSTTYYTARAAALPAMLAAVLCVCLAQHIASSAGKRWITPLALLLLCAGHIAAGRFALIDSQQRMVFAQQSRQLAVFTLAHDASRTEIAVSDWRLLPLDENAWTAPYVTLAKSWISDPLIFDQQKSAILTLAPAKLADPKPPVRFVAVVEPRGNPQLLAVVKPRSPQRSQWSSVRNWRDLEVFEIERRAIPGDGAGPAAP